MEPEAVVVAVLVVAKRVMGVEECDRHEKEVFERLECAILRTSIADHPISSVLQRLGTSDIRDGHLVLLCHPSNLGMVQEKEMYKSLKIQLRLQNFFGI